MFYNIYFICYYVTMSVSHAGTFSSCAYGVCGTYIPSCRRGRTNRCTGPSQVHTGGFSTLSS